jgi:hypothetical protein
MSRRSALPFFKRLFAGVCTFETGQERMVDVDNPPRKALAYFAQQKPAIGLSLQG